MLDLLSLLTLASVLCAAASALLVVPTDLKELGRAVATGPTHGNRHGHSHAHASYRWVHRIRITLVKLSDDTTLVVKTSWHQLVGSCRKTLPSLFGAPAMSGTSSTTAADAQTLAHEAELVDQIVTYGAILCAALLVVGATAGVVAAIKRYQRRLELEAAAADHEKALLGEYELSDDDDEAEVCPPYAS